MHLLHKKCGSRVRNQMFCPVCKVVVDRSDLVCGFELSKGKYAEITEEELESLEAELHRICDPDEVSRRAKYDQQRLLAEVGGKDFVIKRGDLGFSPPPGMPGQFN